MFCSVFEEALSDLPGDLVINAFNWWIKHQIKFPKPAEIRETVERMAEEASRPDATKVENMMDLYERPKQN